MTRTYSPHLTCIDTFFPAESSEETIMDRPLLVVDFQELPSIDSSASPDFPAAACDPSPLLEAVLMQDGELLSL